MDPPKCQTATATPAEPGGLPCLASADKFAKPDNRDRDISHRWDADRLSCNPAALRVLSKTKKRRGSHRINLT